MRTVCCIKAIISPSRHDGLVPYHVFLHVPVIGNLRMQDFRQYLRAFHQPRSGPVEKGVAIGDEKLP